MVRAKRARTAETPKQPSPHLKLRAPYFYRLQGMLVHLDFDQVLFIELGGKS